MNISNDQNGPVRSPIREINYQLSIRFDGNMPSGMHGVISAIGEKTVITLNANDDQENQLCGFLHECCHLFRSDLQKSGADPKAIEQACRQDLRAACKRILSEDGKSTTLKKLQRIAKAEGLTITYRDLRGHDGFIKNKTIVLGENTRGTDQEEKILAHELAHHFLHHGNVIGNAAAEEQATQFAGMLIAFLGLSGDYPGADMPTAMIRALLDLSEQEGARK